MHEDPIGRLRRANPYPAHLEPPAFERLRERIITTEESSGIPASSPQPSQRRTRVGRAVPLLVTAAVAVAVAVGAVVLIGHRGPSRSPAASSIPAGLPPVPNGSPQNQTALRLINQYSLPALRAPACRLSHHQPPVRGKPDFGTPSRQLLNTFGVLRLPATDRPRSVPTFALAGKALVRYARIARRHDHITYEIYPLKSTSEPTSARCAQAQFAAVSARIHQAPAAQRTRVARLAREKLLDARYVRTHPQEICLAGNGGTCGNLLYATTQGLILSGGTGAQPGSTWDYVVPDGVSSITAHYPAEGHKDGLKHQLASVTITAKVTHNLALWTLAHDGGDIFPNHITWRTANGDTVRIVYSP
jgi:hypothetical protein